MKITLFKLVLLVAVTAILSCIITLFFCKGYCKPSERGGVGKPPTLYTTTDTFNLSMAVQDAHTFDSMELSNERAITYGAISAFTIKGEDLLLALNLDQKIAENSPYKCIRVYLGYDNNQGYKLFVVPVKGANPPYIAGQDMFFYMEGNSMVIDSLRGGTPYTYPTPYVLDLNSPCPHTCDNSSPFMPSAPSCTHPKP